MYVELGIEMKNITWFLGKEEFKDQVSWANQTEATGSFRQTRSVDVGEVYKDGSYPVDDIEIEYTNLGFGKVNTYVEVQWLKMMEDLRNMKGSTLPLIVLTNDLRPEDFYNELREHITCETFAEFDRAFKWITKHRYEVENFANLKQMASLLSAENLRGSMQVDQFLNKYYNTKIGTAATLHVGKLLPFTDDEILRLFVETQTASTRPDASTMNKFRLLNERSLLKAAVNQCQSLDENSKLYIGKISSNSVQPTSWLIVGSTNFNKQEQRNTFCVGKLDATYDYSIFKISCINEMVHSGNASSFKLTQYLTIDLNNGQKICEALKKDISSEENDIPGKVIGIRLDQINESLNKATEIVADNYAYSVKTLELIPLSVDAKAADWAQSCTKNVPIHFAKHSALEVLAHCSLLPELTHQSIDEIEATLTACIIHDDAAKRWKTSNKANGPKIEDKKETVGNKLSFAYNILKDAIHFHIKGALGFPDIDRGYIILESILAKHQHDAAKVATLVPKDGKLPQGTVITPAVRIMPYVFALAKVCGSWKEAEERTKEVYLKSKSTANFATLIHETLTKVCSDKQVAVPKVQVFDGQPGAKGNKYKVSTPEGPVTINLDLVECHNIYPIMFQTALVGMSENDSFINFAGTTEKVMNSEDCIKACFRDGCFSRMKLVRSMYG